MPDHTQTTIYLHSETGRAMLADVLDEITNLQGRMELPPNLRRKVRELQEELIFERDRKEGEHAR